MSESNSVPYLAQEGLALVAAGAAITGLTALVSWRAALVPLACTVATAAFLRDPARPLPEDNTKLWSAADGTITQVDEIDEQRFIHGPALRFVTFLSLFNVHINRAPTDGTIRYVEYCSGEFRAAWDADSDLHNERNYVGLETPHGPVLLVQVAGLVARRIVFNATTGDTLAGGQRVGLIKFGSRTDVIVPRSSVEPLVVPGMRVRAGATPLGAWL